VAYLQDHLEKLRAFAVVAQLGSFRKAAVRLHVSQPALSQSVQILEAALGKRLLVRTARGVLPTEEGEALRAFAEGLALDVERLEQKLASAREPMTGLVRVGSFESLTIAFFPGFVKDGSERFPKLTIAITSGTLTELPDMLLDRRIHLAVATMPKKDLRIASEHLFSDHYRLYVADAHVARGARELARLPLVVVPDALDDAGHTILEYLDHAGGRRRAPIALSTFEAVKAFTLSGIGVGVLPSLVARADVLLGRLREIEIPEGPRDGFGEHRILAHMLARERSDQRLARMVEELKRYATPMRIRASSQGSKDRA
jgi:DNA-binding transcriptional LysR family regulator